MKASELLTTEPSPESEWRWTINTKSYSSLSELSETNEWFDVYAPKHICGNRESSLIRAISPEAIKFLQTDEAAAMIKLHHESQ